MDYKYESYLFDICYFCNKLTGKNYTYKRRKNQGTIEWFNEGQKRQFIFDLQLYYGPLNYKALDVAKMVTENV